MSKLINFRFFHKTVEFVRSLFASLGALVVLVAVEGVGVRHGSVGLHGQQRHAHVHSSQTVALGEVLGNALQLLDVSAGSGASSAQRLEL